MGRPVGRSKRDDFKALAAIKDADNSLVMLSAAIHELRPDDEEVDEEFNKFAAFIAKKLAAKLTTAALKESGKDNITTWCE